MSYEPPGGPPPPPQQPWAPQPAGAPYPATAYGTPGYGYAPAAQVKPLKGLATAVAVLVGLTGLVAVWAAIALFHRASVASDFTGFGGVTLQDLRDADSQVSGAVGLLGFALIATGVVWVIWQFRFATNARALRGDYGLAPGWAIGGWFIPLGNFVLPQLQLFQAAKASAPDLAPGQPAAAGTAPASVPAWWIAYDLGAILFSIGSISRPSRNSFDFDLDKFIRADRVTGFACLIYVVAAVIAIVMVRALSDSQMRAAANAPHQQPYQQGYGQPSPPQPWAQPAPPPQPQTWQPPPPNQPWQPPPPPQPPPPTQPWQPPPAPPPPQ
ncbi:MAG: hypothetical protein QOG30_1908 [Acidimicrobiaceae bacterium]